MPDRPEHPAANVWQLDVFACTIDETAGLKDDLEEDEPRCSQLTELPGTEWEHVFGDAA